MSYLIIINIQIYIKNLKSLYEFILKLKFRNLFYKLRGFIKMQVRLNMRPANLRTYTNQNLMIFLKRTFTKTKCFLKHLVLVKVLFKKIIKF